MSKFTDRKSGRAAAATGETSDQGVVSRIDEALTSRSSTARTKTDADSTDYSQLGAHVAAVLEAAKEAASTMKREAIEESERIRGDADERATTIVSDARKQAVRIENEAAQLESAAKQTSDRVREEAEAYAYETRRTADAEAGAIVERAGENASERIRETETHLQTLVDRVTSTEQRLRQLTERLRDLAASLDDLLAGPGAAAADEDEDHVENGSLAEKLTESISEHRRTAQSKEAV